MGSFFTNRRLRVLLYGRNLEDLLPLMEEFPVTLVEDTPDLIITHGGDGSLLGAERLYPNIPKCAIRDRKQNPKCPQHEERETLRKLFNGDLDASRLPKIQAFVNGRLVLEGLNDLVLSREFLSSAIRYRVSMDNQELLPQVVADSLVMATPFGSTGYFQSITHGNFKSGLGLAFNNAMDGPVFSILGATAVISVTILRGPASLVADNNPSTLVFNANDQFQVCFSESTTTVYGLEAFRCQDCYQLRRNGL